MSLPTRTVASHPDLAQLKRQAKELLKLRRSDRVDGDPVPWTTRADVYRFLQLTTDVQRTRVDRSRRGPTGPATG